MVGKRPSGRAGNRGKQNAAVSHAIFSRLNRDLGQHCRNMTELMTIGYEGLTTRDFIDLLSRCRVSMIVDIRELPISRKPGFAKASLAAILEKNGIKYQHVSELGCPREIRHEYRDDGNWERHSRRFKAYLETQEAAIERLIEWTGKNSAACFALKRILTFATVPTLPNRPC